jgi:hypothetical protein
MEGAFFKVTFWGSKIGFWLVYSTLTKCAAAFACSKVSATTKPIICPA